jgi:hypothetical protein
LAPAPQANAANGASIGVPHTTRLAADAIDPFTKSSPPTAIIAMRVFFTGTSLKLSPS